MEHKFYPNIEYNKNRRQRFWIFYFLLILVSVLVSSMFIGFNQWYFAVFMLLFVVLGSLLIPSVLKDHPVNNAPVLSISDDKIVVFNKTVDKKNIVKVKGIIFLGSIGNSIENREFLDKIVYDKPENTMFGSVEIIERTEQKKIKSHFVCVNCVTEAMLEFIKDGKTDYSLGYSLNKLYAKSLYNLKQLISEENEQSATDVSLKQKRKQLM